MGVQTWHSEAISSSIDWSWAISIGSSGQRRIGVSAPTCTGTDSTARTPSGSSTEVPVVTSKMTAPGPA